MTSRRSESAGHSPFDASGAPDLRSCLDSLSKPFYYSIQAVQADRSKVKEKGLTLVCIAKKFGPYYCRIVGSSIVATWPRVCGSKVKVLRLEMDAMNAKGSSCSDRRTW